MLRRASDAAISSGSPPGRSTRPQPPAKSVSPLNSSPASASYRHTEPSVWPGVCRTVSRSDPKRTSPPSARSTAGTEGRISNGAHKGCGSVRRLRSSGWTAISAPVWAATAALSPMWSQWPCVETMSFRVQSRAASSSAIQASDGVAVSIAIASRVRSSASTWTLVAIGPMTRWIRSMARRPRPVSRPGSPPRAWSACSRRSGRSSCRPCPGSCGRRCWPGSRRC